MRGRRDGRIRRARASGRVASVRGADASHTVYNQNPMLPNFCPSSKMERERRRPQASWQVGHNFQPVEIRHVHVIGSRRGTGPRSSCCLGKAQQSVKHVMVGTEDRWQLCKHTYCMAIGNACMGWWFVLELKPHLIQQYLLLWLSCIAVSVTTKLCLFTYYIVLRVIASIF